MMKRIANRLLAVVAVFALALLATHAVSHWHSHAYDADNCQICHVGHAAAPQPTVQVAEQIPTLISHLAIDNEEAPQLEFVSTPSIPRAPPA